MNPVKKTLLTLLGWIILIFFVNLVIGAKGDFNFILTVYAFYLIPVVGIISYVLFLLIDKKSWIRDNLSITIAFGGFLFFWLLSIVFYIYDLFE
ncbi:hypothetical protein SDC9_106099 [bioreactor metagenome]|jgi:hypothetical protein|uniref:Uncharacterized protein n=1 Tax=bioreactor metagenome TaxID=1076179 RepID=A0A645B1H8_9ZZZZ|nr:hypothetical protein [Bacteroides graminisolvens]